MGFEISKPTARKIKAVISKGLRTAQPGTDGAGSPRYDTHVKVTGAYTLEGYPCIVTWYDPSEAVWVEFEDTAYVIDANDAELCVNKRYRALCYGMDDYRALIFVTDIGTDQCPLPDSDSSSSDSSDSSDSDRQDDSDSDSDSDDDNCFDFLADVEVACDNGEIVVNKTFMTACWTEDGFVIS